ncbi:hypothetical protein JRQ81_015897, partial [Phrynocephalus forsythii]
MRHRELFPQLLFEKEREPLESVLRRSSSFLGSRLGLGHPFHGPWPDGNFSSYAPGLSTVNCSDLKESSTALWPIMAQTQSIGRRYIKSFVKGFFVAVPVTITFLDRVACIARVEGSSMQPSLNPEETQISDIVLLNHWSIRNYEVQRGDIVSLV